MAVDECNPSMVCNSYIIAATEQVPTMAAPPLTLSRTAAAVNRTTQQQQQLQQQQLYVQDAAVLEADIPATNGVIHRISQMLQPPLSLLAAFTDSTDSSGAPRQPLMPLQTAGSYDAFTELVQLAAGESTSCN
jgi:Fasciclin domain